MQSCGKRDGAPPEGSTTSEIWYLGAPRQPLPVSPIDQGKCGETLGELNESNRSGKTSGLEFKESYNATKTLDAWARRSRRTLHFQHARSEFTGAQRA